MGERKVILWLHGLGDTGAGWEGTLSEELSDADIICPTAPRQPVTCNGGMRMTSWFDIQDIPLVLTEPENPEGMDNTVNLVHKMLGDIEKNGTPSNQIILGGFSQGGCTSLLAGLSYPKALGGIVAISGWCSTRSKLDWINEANRTTPVLFCSGDGDPVVDISLTRRSAELLKGELGDNVKAMHPKRSMHQPAGEEFESVIQFMKDK